MNDQMKSLVVIAAVGVVAGFLASFVTGGGGLLRYLVSGVVGSFVGSFLLNALNIDLGIKQPLLAQIATGTIGAIVVVLLARMIA